MNEKRKLLPDLQKWDDIFESWRDATDDKPKLPSQWIQAQPTRDRMAFSVFCPVEFARQPILPHERQWVTRYYDVHAKREIEQLVLENTIHVEYDVMNFKIIDWHDGTSLVSCNHSRILGGVWLCLLDNETIPRVPWE